MASIEEVRLIADLVDEGNGLNNKGARVLVNDIARLEEEIGRLRAELAERDAKSSDEDYSESEALMPDREALRRMVRQQRDAKPSDAAFEAVLREIAHWTYDREYRQIRFVGARILHDRSRESFDYRQLTPADLVRLIRPRPLPPLPRVFRTERGRTAWSGVVLPVSGRVFLETDSVHHTYDSLDALRAAGFSDPVWQDQGEDAT